MPLPELHFSEKSLTPLQGRYIIQSIKLKIGIVMSALSLSLADSTHRILKGKGLGSRLELDNINEMTLCTIKAIINQK